MKTKLHDSFKIQVLTVMRMNGRTILISALALILVTMAASSASAQTEQVRYAATLSSGTSEEKRDVLQSFARWNKEIYSRLALRSLSDPDPIVRATAISAVLALPRDEAAREIRKLLSDRHEFVRKEAALALGKVGAASELRSLINMLKTDKKSSVRAAAAVSLGLISEISGISPLLDVLSKKPKKSRAFLRRAAAKSIGQIIESKRVGVSTPANFLPEKYKDADQMKVIPANLRNRINTVLSRVLGNKKETPDARRETAFALGTLRSPESQNLLNQCSRSDDPFLAEICVEAINRLN